MELLSPAGSMESLIAAVQNGADAVYLGTAAFNARAGAANFDGESLLQAVRYCHVRGVKVYITLNTMVREDEMDALHQAVREIYASGADAFIVQDPGVAQVCHLLAPDMALHASTQMAVHNESGVRLLKEKGFQRVVLAREMTLEEIRRCCEVGPEIEVFVHGALCVACSGQCLMSSMIGGRSGNRGQCAQPCRMQYSAENKSGFFLSARDLCTLNDLNALRDAGVFSAKIEGRLKRPEYVATVTGIYRKALDGKRLTNEDSRDLEQIFNRGGFVQGGYLHGVQDTRLMYSLRPDHTGVQAGICEKNGTVRALLPLDEKDTLFIQNEGGEFSLRLHGAQGETLPCREARKGDRLIRYTSQELMRRARESWHGEKRKVPLQCRLTLRKGETAKLTVTDGQSEVSVQGSTVETALSSLSDNAARIRRQLEKTGNTPFVFDPVTLETEEDAFYPVSLLNALRRDALEKLSDLRCAYHRETQTDPRAAAAAPAEKPDGGSRIFVQSGDKEILRRGLQLGAAEAVYAPCDMRALSADGLPQRFYLALPHVTNENELQKLHAFALKNADRLLGVYVNNIGQLFLSWPCETIPDAGMNLANACALEMLGIRGRYTPSLEMSLRQLRLLPGDKDLIIHERVPLMHLRHCPRRAIRGMPGPHEDCRYCDSHASDPLPSLTDRTQAVFPMRRMAYDSGCVVELFNSVILDARCRRDILDAASVCRYIPWDDKDLALLPYWVRAANGQDVKVPSELYVDTTAGHYFRGVL